MVDVTDAATRDPVRKQNYHWRRWSALKTERASWDAHAKDLARNLQPRASRFTTSETNKGGAKHNQIYDNTALRAVGILAAGMMSGLTSPARPWFKFQHPDRQMREFEPVKVWCSEVTEKVLAAFRVSNIYRILHQTYTELGVFGTHAALIMPDDETTVHGTSLTWGEYALATDAKGRVNTLYREMSMTVEQMVDDFGFEACSPAVQSAWLKGDMDSRHDVVHLIEPNREADTSKMDVRNMPFRSCYFELNGPKGKYLRQSGFRRFRAIAPRWNVTGSDVYGDSPGMVALGDAKQLQHEQFRKAQGIDYQTKPPVALPTSAKGQETDFLPGGVSYMDQLNGQGQRNLFEVTLQLDHLLMDIQDVRQRINAAFFVDLFLMISAIDAGRSRMTATEVAERHEEKLTMLGPVLERLHNEIIAPLIDMVFDQLAENGQLPPPPPELEGVALEVELLGILAQAQKAAQTRTVDNFVVSVGNAAAALGKTDMVDNINGDALVEVLADDMGVDPRILVDGRKVQALRQQRAEAQQAAQEAAQNAAVAEGLNKLGSVPTNGGASNAGADAINMFTGYQSPQAERL